MSRLAFFSSSCLRWSSSFTEKKKKILWKRLKSACVYLWSRFKVYKKRNSSEKYSRTKLLISFFKMLNIDTKGTIFTQIYELLSQLLEVERCSKTISPKQIIIIIIDFLNFFLFSLTVWSVNEKQVRLNLIKREAAEIG